MQILGVHVQALWNLFYPQESSNPSVLTNQVLPGNPSPHPRLAFSLFIFVGPDFREFKKYIVDIHAYKYLDQLQSPTSNFKCHLWMIPLTSQYLCWNCSEVMIVISHLDIQYVCVFNCIVHSAYLKMYIHIYIYNTYIHTCSKYAYIYIYVYRK